MKILRLVIAEDNDFLNFDLDDNADNDLHFDLNDEQDDSEDIDFDLNDNSSNDLSFDNIDFNLDDNKQDITKLEESTECNNWFNSLSVDEQQKLMNEYDDASTEERGSKENVLNSFEPLVNTKHDLEISPSK